MQTELTPAQRAARARGAARLRALGIDVTAMDREQIRASYEAQRAAYHNVALAGLHTTPIHGGQNDLLPGAPADSRYGMLTAAIADYYNGFPPDWPPPRHTWPEPGGTHRPTITVAQVNQGILTVAEARAAMALPPAQPRDTEPADAAPAASRWNQAVPTELAAEELELVLEDAPEPAGAAPEEPVFRHWRT